MQTIPQLFRRNQTSWTQKQINQIEDFFLGNQHIAQFYQKKKFNTITKMCYYRKLNYEEKLLLENNNRAEIVVLLSGRVEISKKQRRQFVKKPRISMLEKQEKKQMRKQNRESEGYEEFVFLVSLKQFNQSVKLNTECLIECKDKNYSEFLFIPCTLYNKLQQQIQQDRVLKIQHILQKYFNKLKKKQLRELSKCNCIFKQYKMNNYIYRASSKPQEIFILLEGMIKLQKPGFSEQTLKEKILISSGRIFGETDIKLSERLRNAVACSSHVEVLTIPKIQFLKYADRAFPYLVYEQSQKLSPVKLPTLSSGSHLKISHSLKLSSPQRKSYLPFVNKRHFHYSFFDKQQKKSESEQKRQYQLMKNSHMLVDIKQKSKTKKKYELRNFSPKSKQEKKELFKLQKEKLKQLKVISRFSLDNSLINL